MLKNKGGQINVPTKGLNKDSWALGEGDYNHLQNGNFDSFDGGTFSLTNEASNILASKFKDNFRVIHVKNDIDTENTYFFLVNPTTGEGEFGVIKSNQLTNDLEDIKSNCDNCTDYRELSKPLEEVVQTPLQTYETLISDSCLEDKTKGFNFNINYPIKTSVIKNEKCGKVIYFSDNYGFPKYINISKIEDYFVKKVSCEDDVVDTCPDFEKMRIFKKFDIPDIIPVSIELGGNLKKGTYQFLIAYCNELGNEISEYYSITNPIHIFDKNDLIMEQRDLASRTNYAIKLQIKGLDKNYSHYKIAVIQTADLDSVDRYYTEGIHTIDDQTVIYSTEHGKLSDITIYDLAKYTAKVERIEAMTSSNGILFQYGITNKSEINLQPCVNLMGEFLQWQTHIAPENLYEDGVACSLYKGYNREEVVPFGIKFLLKGGYETAVFPLIGRTPTEQDLEYVVENTDGTIEYDEEGNLIPLNEDVASILSNKGDCVTTDRIRHWQYYNTATESQDACNNIDVETVQIQEEVVRYCTISNIATIPSGELIINNPEDYSSLLEYINTNKATTEEDCSQVFSNPDICSYLYADYSSSTCLGEPFSGLDCGTIVEGDVNVEVQEVVGQNVVKVEKIFPTEYIKIQPPAFCKPYLIDDETGKIIKDSVPTGDPMDIFVRDYESSAEDYNYAIDIQIQQDPKQNLSQAYFNNFYYSLTKSELYTSKISPYTDLNFNTNIHKGGIWFKGVIDTEDKFIVDVSKQKDNTKSDLFDTYPQQARVSIFKSGTATTAIYSTLVDFNEGSIFLFEKVTTPTTTDLVIKKDGGASVTIVDGWFSSKEYFIVVDNAIRFINSTDTYIVTPTKGCYSISSRNIEYSRIEASWTEIILNKKVELIGDCTFEEPIVKTCQAIPFKKGKFSYWESGQTYPDNQELFDSSYLDIDVQDIPENIRDSFETTFVESIVGGKYNWKKDSEGRPLIDFTCRAIRHFKFPSNSVAPFVNKRQKRGFSSSAIFPLGITIDENLINSFLDIAKKNGLISQQDRESIVSYEILRGDMTSNRSIVASGLLYDVRKYKERANKNKYLLYPNYPFNSYAEDKFNLEFSSEDRSDLGKGAVWGESNRNYTFHSPETDYTKVQVPSEVSVQAYMFGQASINFDEVKEHPKYVILTDKARSLASTLATLEVAAEVAIQAAQAFANYNPIVGTSNTTFPGGLVASGIILGFKTASGAVFDYGKYRYEWLKVFKNLGSPQNFAYYSFSEGNYNYIQLEQSLDENGPMYNLEGNLLRGINIGKYLEDGRFISTNETTAEKLEINNIDRERSVFLSTGDFPINYPTTYKTFDKDTSTSSITFSGENNIKDVGRSETIFKNIASPYVYLRNYVVDQHGTINSINWIPTGYRGDLINPNSNCISIFGGDTYICRHTLKRKHSQFLTTAMKQADLTPFNYYFYNNIGKNPKFWLSYELDKDFDSNGKLFPDIVTEKSFDVEAKGGNYYRPPSRFYLYHYGVPNFLCETRINTNFRYGGKELKEQFFPQVGDLGNWTQESEVSIREPNTFYYNSVYSKGTTSLKQRTLPVSYNREDSLCKSNFLNGTIYSLQDNSENSSFDPWLIYRPNDFYEFPKSYGKLKEMRGIENQQILARFENTVAIFNSVNTTVDDGKRPELQYLGDGAIFARRPVTFSQTDLGFGGSQTSTSLSCEFGHYHVDSKRGQVMEIAAGGQGIKEISSFLGDKPSGMRNWFKEHLPFKILNSKIKGVENVDLDNVYNGIGVSMGWDSRFRRVFITKKDYIPLSDCIEYVQGEGFFFNQTQCDDTPQVATCPDGYTFNTTTQMCERVTISAPLCPTGYTYDSNTQTCTLVETSLADCSNYIPVGKLVGIGGVGGAPDTLFEGKTVQEIKCIVESSSACSTVSGNTFVESLPLFVGQQLYRQSGGYIQEPDDTSFITDLPVPVGSCEVLETSSSTKIVEVVGGIITNIAQYQTVIC